MYSARMKRVLYNPIGIFKMLTGSGGGGGGAPPAPAGPSAADLRAQETKAREEAARKAVSDAQARSTAHASLLTDSSLADTFGSTATKKKSLFGG